MKLSQSFWQTYKETPADAVIPSHQLMMRAGLIHKSAAGIYNYLPMGYKTIRKIEQIVREEMDKVGCHELLMSVVTPGELWKESGRWEKMQGEMLRFSDKGERDLCISPTNEEAIVDIFRKTIKSYKQLPLTLYQINTKFRDEIRPRFGLMRGREFVMKDAYSFHTDKASLDEIYDVLFKAYENTFNRIGLEFSAVEADAGNMGSKDSKTHEFQAIADTGEDEIIYCADTGYAANIEKAETLRAELEFNKNSDAVKEISTPDMATIEDVCNFLKCPQHHSLKSLVYTATYGEKEANYLLQVLGDDQLNEVKLKNYLGADHVAPATDNVLKELGLPKGFIGPVGVKAKIKTLIDKAVDLDSAYVAGALKPDMHIENVIPSRDIPKFEHVDLRLSMKGDQTLDGKGVVDVKRGIEIGHIFQLGDKYTKSMGVTVLDSNGKTQHPLMGCYGMGVTRLVGAAIEQNHDEKGIVWPKSIAPYQVYFALIGKTEEIMKTATDIYLDMQSNGIEVVFDDRKAGAGFKFKDADLLGAPLRVVLGERDFKENGMLEVVDRRTGEKNLVDTANLVEKVKMLLEGIK